MLYVNLTREVMGCIQYEVFHIAWKQSWIPTGHRRSQRTSSGIGRAWRLYQWNMTVVQSGGKGYIQSTSWVNSYTPVPHPPTPNPSTCLWRLQPASLSAGLLYWLMELPHQAECHSLTRYWLLTSRKFSHITRGHRNGVSASEHDRWQRRRRK